MANLNNLLQRLLQSGIDFVLIGGYAAVVHGSSQVTQDIDICAVITPENLGTLRDALRDLDPRHRMNPSYKPSLMDYPAQDQSLDNYYLQTTEGILDIIREVRPVGSFERIKEKAIEIEVFGLPCKVISLDDLIEVKKSMSRPKDRSTLEELEYVRYKQRSGNRI